MHARKILSFFLVLYLWAATNPLFSQRIRKDHREMTPTEKMAFVEAVKLNKMNFYNQGLHHECHGGGFVTNSYCPTGNSTFQNVHGVEIFLPWHRYFQWDVERLLREKDFIGGGKITIPYWDWRVETSAANSTWDDYSFLGQFNSDPNWTDLMNLSRFWTSDLNNVAPSSVASTVNSFMGYNDYHNFRTVLEGTIHAWGHIEIGGEMSGQRSPWDPVFFLHHGMLDKLWQEWEEKSSGFQTTFVEFNQTADYSFHPNQTRDSRSIPGPIDPDHQVWYAYNKKLLLDGMDSEFAGRGTYCYTAWNGTAVEGTIYAGDVKRDGGDNVVLDNKGGFSVQSETQVGAVEFRAGKAIYLMGGFKTLQGAKFSAQCVTTPCGFSSNTLVSPSTPELAALNLPKRLETTTKIQIVPNPIGDALNIQYEVENEAQVQIHVFNVLGQIVAQYQPGVQAPGQYTFSAPTQSWAKGIYNCRVSIGKESTSVKAVH